MESMINSKLGVDALGVVPGAVVEKGQDLAIVLVYYQITVSLTIQGTNDCCLKKYEEHIDEARTSGGHS